MVMLKKIKRIARKFKEQKKRIDLLEKQVRQIQKQLTREVD